jgi:hypothetical protein
MNKLKKTTKLLPGEYIMIKNDRSTWTIFTVLNPEMLIAIKNENIDHACKKEIGDSQKTAKEHNGTLTEDKIAEIKDKWEKLKWRFEDGLSFLKVDEALKQGIIQKVDNGYYMPTLDYAGMGIINKLKQHAKRKS